MFEESSLKRTILTGAPGCGKTSVLFALELTGASTVAEAATDIITYRQMQGIAAPWEQIEFIDDITRVQKHRQIDLCADYSDLHFYDRSPICTYALAQYLGFKPTDALMSEIKRMQNQGIYEKRVFFIQNLGFIKNTEARKISFEESLNFEKIHLESYAKFDYECVMVPVMSVEDRAQFILERTYDDNR